MSQELNAENRNANVLIRCCSFCREPGHTITRCNHEMICRFERETINYIHSIIQRQNINYMESFRRHVCMDAIQMPDVVRAFAIRKCGANTRNNIGRYISLTIEYFIPIIENMRIIQESRSQERQQPGLLRSGYEYLTQNSQETTDYIYAMMLIEMTQAFRELTEDTLNRNMLNRKFCLRIKILDTNNNLEEKCDCNICYNEYEKKNFIKLDCGHEFCKDCMKKSLQNEIRETPRCAYCRSDIKNLELRLETIKNEFNDLITSEI
jgi:hypothetical protein